MDPKHLLRQLMMGPTTAHEYRLRSHYTFVPAVLKLLKESLKLSNRAAQWTVYKWEAKIFDGESELSLFVSRLSVPPLDIDLPRSAWAQLDRLRTSFRRFQSVLHDAQTETCFYINLQMWRIRENRSLCDYSIPITSCLRRIS